MLHRIREAVRPLVPQRARTEANRVVFAGIGLALHGDGVRCPCCGHSYRRFVRYPTLYCPACGSYERQRLLSLYLDANPELLAGDVLQIGPERSIRDRFRRRAGTWLAVDVDPAHPLADAAMDVRALPLPDASFDLVLCAHVLDIVDEHDDAVAELHRVTRPGGRALVQAPWRSVHGDPAAYAERLSRSGFDTEAAYLPEQTDQTLRTRYGIDGDDPIYVCLRRAA